MEKAEKRTDQVVYSVEEVAALLGISRAFAYQSVKNGLIPSVRIGKRVLIPRAAFDRLLEVNSKPEASNEI